MILFTLALFACDVPGPSKDAVAYVGDVGLTPSELEAQLPYGADEQERRRTLENWLGRELLYQEAIARELDQRPRLQAQLERTRQDLLVAALLDDEFGREEVLVEEGEIYRYYEEHDDEFHLDAPEIRARHILLNNKREANARRASLQNGADFAEVAREHSQDTDTRFKGGELGYFSEADEPALWRACQDLELNSFSRPVRTEYGYHIMQVLERQEAGTLRPLEQVRALIVEKIVWQKHRQRLHHLVESLKNTKDWAINSP